MAAPVAQRSPAVVSAEEAARQAHVNRLRQRQAALLSGHKSLTDRDRDTLVSGNSRRLFPRTSYSSLLVLASCGRPSSADGVSSSVLSKLSRFVSVPGCAVRRWSKAAWRSTPIEQRQRWKRLSCTTTCRRAQVKVRHRLLIKSRRVATHACAVDRVGSVHCRCVCRFFACRLSQARLVATAGCVCRGS